MFSIAFSPDGKRIASAGRDGATVWDASTGHKVLSIPGHAGLVHRAAYYPDGSRFVTCGEDGAVRVFDATSVGEVLTLRGHSGDAHCVAVSRDSSRIVSGGEDGTVRVWNSATGEEVLLFKGHAASVHNVLFSSDGERIASADYEGPVRIWNAVTGQEIRDISAGSLLQPGSVALSPDGRLLATSTVFPPADSGTRVWDVASGRVLYRIEMGFKKVAFSPDGLLIAAVTEKGSTSTYGNYVHLFQATDGGWVRPLMGGKRRGSINDVAFAPDGRRLASGLSDGSVTISDTVTGLETLTLEGHTNEVTSVAFSPDGQRLISASKDGTVKVWDARRLDTEPDR
jgi:WD40 repeat protein